MVLVIDDDYYDELDNNQKNAVTYTGSAPLLVSAGPGAGKTRVLVKRIRYLLDNGAKPESFLVITFSRKSAKELKERLSNKENKIPTHIVNKMQISTIHSFCNKLLKDNGKRGFNILSEDNDERRNMFVRHNRKKLGFERESQISGKYVDSLVNTFNEYSTFKVDKKGGLIKYIKENYPISPRYLELINSSGDGEEFEYPFDEVRDDEELSDSQFNSWYLTVAEAYEKYLDLLEKNNYLDFNLLQMKALELLSDEDNPNIAENTGFKNILIDEFQDTDPIQMEIFKYFMDVADTFTVVGDDDQSIYGFRGSFPYYFNTFKEKYHAEEIVLDTNYRSDKKIVDLNEKYIKDKRESPKKLVPGPEAGEGYVKSLSFVKKEEQPEYIAELIIYLKENKIVKKYSDIGVLYNSVKGEPARLLMKTLKYYGIPYDSSDTEPLLQHAEVKAIVTLIWYLKSSDNRYVPRGLEKDGLNLRTFSNKYFKLSKSTVDILNNITSEYENKIINYSREYCETNNIELEEEILTYENVLSLDYDTQKEIFENVERPIDLSVLTREELTELGIKNEHDLDFFIKLNDIKTKQESEKDRITLLEIYYILIDMLDIKDVFEDDSYENRVILNNLALLSRTVANYEEVVNKYWLDGFYWYLNDNIKNYQSPKVDNSKQKDAIKLMTIHKSKGLEFPVTIIGNIRQSTFPRYRDVKKRLENKPSKFDYKGQPIFPTPNEYLDYKNVLGLTDEEDYKQENKEEERVLYVGMTRAQNILILSNAISEKGKASKIISSLKDDAEYFTDLTKEEFDEIPVASAAFPKDEKEPEEEKIEISFTKYHDYNKCPHDYNFKYNIGFVNSPNERLLYGTIAHGIVDQIHQRVLNGHEVIYEDILDIFERTEKYNENIDAKDTNFHRIKESIIKYWYQDGSNWEIVDSERPFDVIKETYNLVGQIDLIIKEGNDITIVDFKTTDKPILPEDKKSYIEQLSMYAIALKEDPEFSNYNINKGMIYTIKNNTQHFFDLDDESISRMEKSIEKTVENIKHERFGRCNNPNCKSCNRF